MHTEPTGSGIVRSDRRVVITGIGVTAPGGIGTKAFWELLTAGRTATRAITLFDASGFRSRVAAECDFDPAAEGLSPQEIRRMDRAAQFGVVCAREALADSGLRGTDVPPERIGVSIGSAVGCTMGLEEEYVVLSDGGRRGRVGGGGRGARVSGLHRVHGRAGRGRYWLQSDLVRPRRRGDRRRYRRTAVADHRGLFRCDQGHITEQQRPCPRLAAV